MKKGSLLQNFAIGKIFPNNPNPPNYSWMKHLTPAIVDNR